MSHDLQLWRDVYIFLALPQSPYIQNFGTNAASSHAETLVTEWFILFWNKRQRGCFLQRNNGVESAVRERNGTVRMFLITRIRVSISEWLHHLFLDPFLWSRDSSGCDWPRKIHKRWWRDNKRQGALYVCVCVCVKRVVCANVCNCVQLKMSIISLFCPWVRTRCTPGCEHFYWRDNFYLCV